MSIGTPDNVWLVLGYRTETESEQCQQQPDSFHRPGKIGFHNRERDGLLAGDDNGVGVAAQSDIVDVIALDSDAIGSDLQIERYAPCRDRRP